MSTLRMKPGGEIVLPRQYQKRYGFTPKTPIRIIETQSGVLLVPLTKAPMNEELRKELAEWQSLSIRNWQKFPYQED